LQHAKAAAEQFKDLDRWGCLLRYITDRIAPVIEPPRPGSGSRTRPSAPAACLSALLRRADTDRYPGLSYACATFDPSRSRGESPVVHRTPFAMAITAAVAVGAGAAPPAPQTTSNEPSLAASIAAGIDSFGFDSRMQMGVGGYLYPSPVPVVLFRNGDALTDISGLGFRGGIQAHKLAHPKAWTHWRRSGGQLQLRDSKQAWRKLPYQATYAKLPAGFRLDGTYGSISGTGTAAVGGSDSVVAWREYAFARDGRVVRGGGAGAYAAIAGGGSTAVSSVAPDRRGRYRIDGITLQISYDSGATESRIIVTDPNDPKGAIWLDGTGYTRKSKK
jgi:hypothetical protein